MIPDWKGPESKDRELLTPTGRWIAQSLVKGWKMELPNVKAEMTGVTAGIPQWVNNAAPRQYQTVSTTGSFNANISVDARGALPGTEKKIAREVAREIREALDEYDRSLKR